MKRPISKFITIILSLTVGMALLFSACGAGNGSTGVPDAGNAGTEEPQADSDSASAAGSNYLTYELTETDADASWDESGATMIVFSGSDIDIAGSGADVSDQVVTISRAGTYVLSGQADNAQIIVYAGNDDVVRLVLNGLDITCVSGAPVYSMQAGKTVLILADGTENFVADSSSYSQVNEDGEPNAAIFVKDDLSITGTGSLTVKANYEDAIAAKDVLVVADGTINIEAADDGMRGTDGLVIAGGEINISAGAKAIRSTKDTDEEQGFVLIKGGTINVTESVEGVEAPRIQIDGGVIGIAASDDGLNAAGETEIAPGGMGGGQAFGSSNADLYFARITGGTIDIKAGYDGIDVNGNLYIDGGDIGISAQSMDMEGAIDIDGSIVITGGNLITAGTLMAPGSASTQASIRLSYTEQQSQGSVIEVKDASGNVLLSYTSRMDFRASGFSSGEFVVGETYSIYIDEVLICDVTLTDTLTSISSDGGSYSAGGMGGGQGGNMGGAQGGGMQGGTPPADGGQRPGGNTEQSMNSATG